MRVVLALVVLTAGCAIERAGLGVDAGPPPADTGMEETGVDGGEPPDATDPTDARGADGGPEELGPFRDLHEVSELIAPSQPDARDDDPTLTGDMLEIFFNSERTGVEDGIWTARRASVDEPFSTPTPVLEVSIVPSTNPSISPDGLTLWFATRLPGSFGEEDVWVSTRPSRSALFSTPVHVREVSSTADEDAKVDATGLTMLLSSDRLGDGDVFRSTRATLGGTWSIPVAVPELSSDADDRGPYLVARRFVYLDSSRPGGMGSYDLYVASRPDSSGRFGAPVPIAELNTPDDDGDVWVSEDRRTIYWATDRDGGTRKIWTASR